MIKLGLIVRRFKSRYFRRQCENTVYKVMTDYTINLYNNQLGTQFSGPKYIQKAMTRT